MLQDMPIGNRYLYYRKRFKWSIWFCIWFNYTTCLRSWAEDVLKNLTVELLIDGRIELPRTPFHRWINSEQMKSAIKQDINLKCCVGYKFERGKYVFKKYVTEIDEIKKNSLNPVEKKYC